MHKIYSNVLLLIKNISILNNIHIMWNEFIVFKLLFTERVVLIVFIHPLPERSIFETADGDIYARFNASNREISALLLLQLAAKVGIEWFYL